MAAAALQLTAALEARDGVWCYVEVLDSAGEPDLIGWVHGNYLAAKG